MVERVRFENKQWIIPLHPEIGYILGDGTGVDITPVALQVIDAAVEKAYQGTQKIHWTEILASERALAHGKELLPAESLEQIKQLRIVLKGPLETPIGGGHRSLNVTLRQQLDLFACIRPVKYFTGVPNPMKNPENVDVVIFRENTEDVYAGIEWPHLSAETTKLIHFLKHEMNIHHIRTDSGIGIKPMSKSASQRLVRSAIRYALDHTRTSVTLVHKGNIMKYTEGAFKDWGYQVAREEFAESVIFESDLTPGATTSKLIIKDRIADSMFQQLLLRPEEYAVLATSNLNGDYLSDAAAAQVGGLGIAPGANINDDTGIAIFEATHGTAPKHAGQDKVNPGSMILSGVMMLELMGWNEAAALVVQGMERTIQQKKVTYDLARQMVGATEVKCSEFGREIIQNMNSTL